MNLPIYPYIVVISISGVLSLLLGLYVFLNRKRFTNSTTFLWMTILSSVYSLGHAVELSSGTLKGSIFWIHVQYIGMPFIAPLSLLLVLRYTGIDRLLKKQHIVLLLVIPAITMLLNWTNAYHHLMYRSIWLLPDNDYGLVGLVTGPWYIVHGCYTFGSLFLSVIILARHWSQAARAYWKQIATLLLGNLLPMTGAFLYLIGQTPYGMDPVPIIMCLTNAMYFWAIFSKGLFDLSPLARERIFESMQDGVIVIDSYYRIVDLNQSAKRMLGQFGKEAIGKDILSIWPEEVSTDTVQTHHHEFEWHDDQTGKHYQISSTPIFKGSATFIGKTVVLTDITEQKNLEERLKQLAYMDGLTQICNRAYFWELSEREIARALKNGTHLSLILFDIDHFKQINDVHGHGVGDSAILHVVNTCKKLLPEETIFGRYGGEEFIICLPKKDLYDAALIAEQMRAAIADTPLEPADGLIVPLTASFGAAELKEPSCTLDALLHEADLALYASKNNGRNAVHLAVQNASLRFENMEIDA